MERAAKTGGVVAAGHPAVARAGRRVLARGGNAVDAAIAAMFTAFQAEPVLATAAGAGFLVADLDGEAVAYDFFATAPGLGRGAAPYQPPAGAFWGVEVDFGAATQTFHIGPGSVAVPGALAGLCEAQQAAGRLDLATVLQPAIEACHEGTQITALNALVLGLLAPIVRSTPEFARHLLDPSGAVPGVGHLHRNPDLGAFFSTVAQARSARVLHDGPLTGSLLEVVQRGGGGLTAEDLRRYEVRRLAPVEALIDGGRVRLMLAPHPSSGGMLIAYSMALLEGAPPTATGSAAEALLLRAVMAETLRARAELLGAETPDAHHAARLLDGAHVEAGRRRLASLLTLGAAPLPVPASTDNPVGSTTHVSAIDAQGNACSITISSGECSGLVLPGCGVFLNNFLGEEDLNPCGFHRFAPGARLGSTMTPTLARSRDGAIIALGTGGSNRIRSAILQVLRNLFHHRMPVAQAVAADRLHYEGGVLYGEATSTMRDALEAVAAAGAKVARFDAPNMFFGGVHTALRAADGRVVGVGDDRRCGEARVV